MLSSIQFILNPFFMVALLQAILILCNYATLQLCNPQNCTTLTLCIHVFMQLFCNLIKPSSLMDLDPDSYLEWVRHRDRNTDRHRERLQLLEILEDMIKGGRQVLSQISTWLDGMPSDDFSHVRILGARTPLASAQMLLYYI